MTQISWSDCLVRTNGTALENGTGSAGTVTFNGIEANMLLSAQYLG